MIDTTAMILDTSYNPTQGFVDGKDNYLAAQPTAPLNRWVQSFWQLNVPNGRYEYLSVPDNCVDWIISLDQFEDDFVISPFTSSTRFQLVGPTSYFGIRFRVMGHKGLTKIPVGEWSAHGSLLAQAVFPTDIVYSVFETLTQSTPFPTRCENISRLLLASVELPPVDSRLARFVRYCCSNLSSKIDLSDKACGEFGVSARQLRRISMLNLGVLPKDFARVLRFQSALKALYAHDQHLTFLDHYYDQPHFVREFKRISGLTPGHFRNMSVLYNR